MNRGPGEGFDVLHRQARFIKSGRRYSERKWNGEGRYFVVA